ncbi:CGNR zinc finger domain-containing protein [Salinicola halophyticus]|uniref:CGNR zinc finger domain-containing protein n=1 Tax=Salinicola halophyticus TaxID=1808881 RepID=UPI003F451D97
MHYWQSNGFFGGHIALDFVNTIDDEDKQREHSGIPDWHTTVEWAQAVGLLGSALPPTASDIEVEQHALHTLREVAWRILSAIAAGKAADPADMAALKRDILHAGQHATLRQHGKSVVWHVNSDSDVGEGLIRTRVALELANLFSQGPLERLRECYRCTGLFLDRGRGAGRRWCRMETCGNRAKIERYRARSR